MLWHGSLESGIRTFSPRRTNLWLSGPQQATCRHFQTRRRCIRFFFTKPRWSERSAQVWMAMHGYHYAHLLRPRASNRDCLESQKAPAVSFLGAPSSDVRIAKDIQSHCRNSASLMALKERRRRSRRNPKEVIASSLKESLLCRCTFPRFAMGLMSPKRLKYDQYDGGLRNVRSTWPSAPTTGSLRRQRPPSLYGRAAKGRRPQGRTRKARGHPAKDTTKLPATGRKPRRTSRNAGCKMNFLPRPTA